MGPPLIILGLIVLGLAVGATFVFASPILAIPILLLAPGPIVTLEIIRRQSRKRRLKRFRESAKAQKADFTSGDRQTLA